MPLLLSSLLDRYRATNVTTIALTHTVYGSPNLSSDAVDQVFPPEAIQELLERTSRRNTSSGSGNSTAATKPLRILTRLHAVVESASDLRHFQIQQQQQQGAPLSSAAASGVGGTSGGIVALLRGYDLVSVAPRNDAVFQAACEISKDIALFDMITLEYFSGGTGGGIGSRAMLPFKIKSGHVRSAAQNGIAMEVPYAPALLNHHESPSYRRAFVQTLHELKSAALGHKPQIVLSSGPRRTLRPSLSAGEAGGGAKDGTLDDAGPLALRMPGDLVNLLATVLRWKHADAVACVTTSPVYAAGAASRQRRFGPAMAPRVRSVRADRADGAPAAEDLPAAKKGRREQTVNNCTNNGTNLPRDGKGDSNDYEEGIVFQDGFISLN